MLCTSISTTKELHFCVTTVWGAEWQLQQVSLLVTPRNYIYVQSQYIDRHFSFQRSPEDLFVATSSAWLMISFLGLECSRPSVGGLERGPPSLPFSRLDSLAFLARYHKLRAWNRKLSVVHWRGDLWGRFMFDDLREQNRASIHVQHGRDITTATEKDTSPNKEFNWPSNQ